MAARLAIPLLLIALFAGAGAAHAHPGLPPEPHDLPTAWNFSPALWLGLAVGGWAYARGGQALARRHAGAGAARRGRALCFWAGLAVLFAALVSPLDALGGALFSAHMVQHMLLIVAGAPLLVLGDPLGPVLLALPEGTRQAVGRAWRGAGWLRGLWHALSRPAVAWVLHAGVMWAWHAPALYQAALRSELVHGLEHFSFLATALLYWWRVLPAGGRRGAGQGWATLSLFAMGMQSGLLGALMTFAPQPWYPAYALTTAPWGLTPLEDQQLAGAIMWVPSGLVYTVAAVVGMGVWLERMEERSEVGSQRSAWKVEAGGWKLEGEERSEVGSQRSEGGIEA